MSLSAPMNLKKQLIEAGKRMQNPCRYIFIEYQWKQSLFIARQQVGHLEVCYSWADVIICEYKGMQFDVPNDTYEF